VLFSMSHTGLIDRHYLSRKIAVRDVSLLIVSLCIYWASAFIGNLMLTYIGSFLFFLHISYLTWMFYYRFYHIYKRLEQYADYLPNDTDKEVLWMHYSCHLIITFGIGGMLCTVLFHDATLPFTILLLIGVIVFTYIYKALDNFGSYAIEAERNLQGSEEYEDNDCDDDDDNVDENDEDYDYIKERIEQWIAERHYTDSHITIKDALRQMDISDKALSYYLERHTTMRGYRHWITTLRIDEAKRLMVLHREYTLHAIAQACGYSDNSSLSRSFKAQEGVSPKEWLESQK